ncbi:hypothetical protein AB4K05_14490 [Kluyvera sp. STS39-E]|uniref:hypothetical protein n=1 Tax=Kluyvera sp. STS39-E TaxID=3234748 RepID=UPI0034C5D6CE
MKKIIISVLLLTSFSATARYLECSIFNGKISSCGTWAQSESTPIKQSDGRYHDCSIVNGSVFSCSSWTQAKNAPVLQSDGFYRSCSIFNGSVSSCGSWYQGNAVINRD